MVFHAITCQEEVVGMMIMMMRAITMTMKEGHTEQMQQQQGKALMFFPSYKGLCCWYFVSLHVKICTKVIGLGDAMLMFFATQMFFQS